MLKGRVIGLNSGHYKVLGEDKEIYVCRARGKLRNMKVDKHSDFNINLNKKSTKLNPQIIKISPKVGDFVTFEINNGVNFILDVDVRKNELVRPDISNVDQILLVFAAKQPDFSTYLLDLFLVNLELKSILPIIIISKIDLMSEKELKDLKEALKYYENIGYKIILVNSIDKENIEEVIPLLKDKVSVLSGQTGAGKSTLINALIPGFNLATQEISKALNRGKHTTRETSLYQHYGGLIGDTPGFSKLDLSDCDINKLHEQFIEFSNVKCKFSTCVHINEPGCSVKKAVENNDISKFRYENYLKMYSDKKNVR